MGLTRPVPVETVDDGYVEEALQTPEPPTQAERIEALKAIMMALKQTRAIYDRIGGKEGHRDLAIARQFLETAYKWAKDYIMTTQKPWR
jgi:hypothetical protein